jgi:predicted Zn-dependent protease with MMP-like domain
MKGSFDDPSASRSQPASLADIESLASQAFARLPAHFRAFCADLVIRVADFPASEVLNEMGLSSRYDLLGLFQGIGLPFRQDMTGTMPNMIWLYRKPILAYWTEHQESLTRIITHVLVHEIGHHFGFSDEDMAAIEAAAS